MEGGRVAVSERMEGSEDRGGVLSYEVGRREWKGRTKVEE